MVSKFAQDLKNKLEQIQVNLFNNVTLMFIPVCFLVARERKGVELYSKLLELYLTLTLFEGVNHTCEYHPFCVFTSGRKVEDH